MKALLLLLVLAGAVPSAGWAQSDASPPPRIESLQVLRDQQNALQVALEKGELPGLTVRQAKTIRKAQREFFAATDGKASLDTMSMEERIRVENALERINAEVKGTRVGQDEQQVCWRERTTGSNMKTTRCGTKAEKDLAREGARGFLERPRSCAGDCGGIK